MLKPLLGPCDSYQLEPFEYEWAWVMSKQQESNTWQPEEIGTASDVADYKDPTLDPRHKHLFESVMAQLTTFDIERGDDAAETFLSIMQPAEIRHYLKRLVWDECVVEGTEVLTQSGWAPVESISCSTLIAQWWRDSTLSWTYPTKISVSVRDNSVALNTKDTLQQHVTLGHRVPYWTDTGELLVKEAGQLTANGHAKHPLCGSMRSGPTQKTALSCGDRFLIALQADGSLSDRYTGERCGTVPVIFSLKKQRKQDRLEAILAECNWPYKAKIDGRGRKVYAVSVPLADITPTKEFNDWVKLGDISCDWAKAFVEEVSYWDGHRVNGYNRIEYNSTNKNNSDMVCAVAALAGYATKVVRVEDGRSTTFNDVHWVYINKARKYAKGGSLDITAVSNVHTFYGVEVPSTFMLIRYNGRVSVTGNCVHTRSYRYVIENLGIPLTIYDRWKEVPAMRERVGMAQEMSAPVEKLIARHLYYSDHYSMMSTEDKQVLLRSMIFWFLIFEGVWFWVNLLGPIQQLSRLGRFKGAAEQFQYIARDEQSHIGFGHRLIQEFMTQYPECLTERFLATIVDDVEKAIRLEEDFASYCLKDGPILGYSIPEHVATAKLFANMRLGAVGLPQPFMDAYHAFPWMSEQMELKKEKNFFESRVTEYQAGGALQFDDLSHHDGWDDPLTGIRSL